MRDRGAVVLRNRAGVGLRPKGGFLLSPLAGSHAVDSHKRAGCRNKRLRPQIDPMAVCGAMCGPAGIRLAFTGVFA
jgi:hypothetical protein